VSNCSFLYFFYRNMVIYWDKRHWHTLTLTLTKPEVRWQSSLLVQD